MRPSGKNMNKSLKFISKYFLKEKKLFAIGILTTLLGSFFTWLSPQLLARIIDESFAKKLIIFFALSELLKLTIIYTTQKTFALFGQNIIERVRENMIQHLMRVSVSYFDRTSSGQLMTRVVNDVNSLTDFFQSGMVSIVGNCASILAIFIGIYSLNHRLAFFLFVFFLPFLYACSVFSKKLKVAYENTRNELSHFNSLLADFLFGMKTIRSLSLTEQKNKILSTQIDRYSQAQVKMVNTFALFNPVLSLGIGVLFLILIIVGIPMVDHNLLKTGEWVAILSYIFSLQQPLMEITDRWNYFLSGLTSIDRIRNVFAEPSEKSGTLKPEKMKIIELNKLSFRYQSSNIDVIKLTSFRIHSGDRIGVYGETGMGKSTLLQLLYGFYTPTQGLITWNGVSYQDLSIHEIRNYFGVVEQFPLLFSGSVKDNITLFDQFQFDLVLLKEQFKEYKLISSILNRLNEEVRERGSNFSMGEKQMISFLRAFLKNPQIWIFDEATAFFDPEAEKEFMNALNQLDPEIVIIQIAHRKEALQQMDRYLKVEEGLVVELSK